MQTNLLHNLLNKNEHAEAQNILQNCVHCGFCLSTCPTYLLLGDEANSPRGRIYTIKSMLEGERVTTKNLDQCLICKSCETTCPSGVEYGNLLEIGQKLSYNNKNIAHKTAKFLLRKSLTTPLLVNIASLKNFATYTQAKHPQQPKELQQSVILHTGCVQKPLAPNINLATIKVLNTLGFKVIETPQKECCAAIDLHNGGEKNGTSRIKKNIDNWLKMLETSSVIISTASGCGTTIKDYANILKHDTKYYKKAQIISQKTQDISEFLTDKDLSVFKKKDIKISYHEPCTLQHGQGLQGLTHSILQKIGYDVKVIKDNHLCCGSAGTYSMFNPKIAKTLRTNKLKNLADCEIIATSNIGCLMHLQKGTQTPVKHWIELLAD